MPGHDGTRSLTPFDRTVSARMRVSIANLIGLLAGVAVGVLWGVALGVLAGWDVASAVFTASVWLTIRPLDATTTARLAAVEDPTRAGADLLLLSAATASLVAVGFVLGGAAHSSGVTELAHVGLGLASVVLSWAVVHTIFTLAYARLYYAEPRGGVNFNEEAPPDYRDFAYLSFTIGMTFQVSDTNLETKEIRRTALRHALLSYAFGAGIIATTINLIATITGQ